MDQPPRFADDRIVFRPGDVDLSRSPLRGLGAETYTLGAFNPGFTRLPNGNLLMMVRVAEALRQPTDGGDTLVIRWTPAGYVLDRHPLKLCDKKDPRATELGDGQKALLLTSLSWLLPVEFNRDGTRIIATHYDKAVAPQASYQAYGVEDARISRIDDRWFMTTCSVSPERQCTTLYTSPNAMDWTLEGVVLDHQNKDMLLFEGRVGGRFFALTRPTGDAYFAYPPGSEYLPGPSINLASSPDAMHWRPYDKPGIRARRGSPATQKIGGGAPPIRTPHGWLVVYHGVDYTGLIGVYRTFWALLDHHDPSAILRMEDRTPLLESRPDLTPDLEPQKYLSDVVYTCGAVVDGEEWLLLASGEDDLACRLTRVPLSHFAP
jgi:predicted GH43/DUF377 family glycosyl hydrolase